MSSTAIDAILLLSAVGLASGGQLSMKAGMIRVGEVTGEDLSDFKGLVMRAVRSFWVIAGFVMFAFSAFFWLIVLSRVKLSIAYPMIAAGYVMVVFLSWLLFDERIKWIGRLGLVLIVAGVIITAQGLKSDTDDGSRSLLRPAERVSIAVVPDAGPDKTR